jgi:hypothetical protein
MQYVDPVVEISKPHTYLSWEEATVLNAVRGEDPPFVRDDMCSGRVRVRCHTIKDRSIVPLSKKSATLTFPMR